VLLEDFVRTQMHKMPIKERGGGVFRESERPQPIFYRLPRNTTYSIYSILVLEYTDYMDWLGSLISLVNN
jgi:hypothetical protein